MQYKHDHRIVLSKVLVEYNIAKLIGMFIDWTLRF